MDSFLKEIEARKDEFYRYVLRNVWDSSVADDVFSSAVLAAYKSRQNFKPGSNFRAWMFKILTNKCFVANREISRRGENLDDYQDVLTTLPQNQGYSKALDNPDDFLVACGDEVLMAMKKLSTMERSCLLLRTMENFSYKEIGRNPRHPFWNSHDSFSPRTRQITKRTARICLQSRHR